MRDLANRDASSIFYLSFVFYLFVKHAVAKGMAAGKEVSDDAFRVVDVDDNAAWRSAACELYWEHGAPPETYKKAVMHHGVFAKHNVKNLVIVVCESQVVGVATLKEKDATEVVVCELTVDAGFRRRGVGRMVLRECVKRAHPSHVVCEVAATNRAAINFFDKTSCLRRGNAEKRVSKKTGRSYVLIHFTSKGVDR